MAIPVAWAEQDQEAFPRIEWGDTANDLSRPIWVIADEAVDSSGDINWKLLGDTNASTLKALLKQGSQRLGRIGEANPLETVTPESSPGHEGGCLNLAEFIKFYLPGEELPPSEEMEFLIDGANMIFEGRVVAVKGGLFQGNPGSLLKVEVQRVLKSSMWREVLPIVYVYHVNATFRLGSHNICNQHPLFPHLPTAVDTVIVFSVSGPAEASGRFYSPNEIVFESGDGGVSMSPRMERLPAFSGVKNAYDVEQYVHRALTRDRSEITPSEPQR